MAGKAIVMFEGRHQFEELPVLRRRGKQKEKGYRHKVKNKQKNKSPSNYLLEGGQGGGRKKYCIFEIQVIPFGRWIFVRK